MTRAGGLTQSLLRIVAGLLFVCPGAMKLLGAFGGMPPGYPLTHQLAAAGWIELVGGTLILLGLFTRPVAFVCSGEMAFAYFIGHAPHGFWPIVNHGEPAVLFCFIFLYFAANGGGPISVDAWFARTRRARVSPARPAAAFPAARAGGG